MIHNSEKNNEKGASFNLLFFYLYLVNYSETYNIQFGRLMLNEFHIDSNLLENICTILDKVTTPDNSVQKMIFQEFQNLHAQLPTFSFYLVSIISSDQFSMNRRFCALLVLHKIFYRIPQQFTEKFIVLIKPILEQIIKMPFSPFTNVTVSLYSSLFHLYSDKYLIIFQDFFAHILTLFHNPETIQIGINCIYELLLSENDKIPIEIFNLIPQFINSPFFKEALLVTNSLMKINIDFVYNQIIPSIFSAFSNFDEFSMSKAAEIVSYVYLTYPNQVIGDFLVSCLNCRSRIISESLLSQLSDPKSIFPYPPLILALLQQMSEPDNDCTEFGPSSMAQQIVQTMNDCYGDEISNIVKSFLPNCENQGHFLRCLYTILSTIPDSSQFLPFILSQLECQHLHNITNNIQIDGTTLQVMNGENNGEVNVVGEFRGDAALCLMSFCFSNPGFVNDAMNKIIPLLADKDRNVRFQAILALTELIEFEFEPNFNHFFFLINLMKETNNSEIARLASRYSLHFPIFNDSQPIITGFYQDLVLYFLNYNSEHCLYQYMIDMFSLFILAVNEPFETFNKNVFVKLLTLLNEIFDESIFSSYFELTRSLFKAYSNFFPAMNGEFLQLVEALTKKMLFVMMNETENILLVKTGFEILEFVFSIFVRNDSFKNCFFELSLRYFSKLCEEFEDFIMNIDIVKFLLLHCCQILTSSENISNGTIDIKILGLCLMMQLTKSHEKVDPNIQVLFE
ncbi:hypothetical protein TRFO_07950 [Tritrichomonas foetus]|uniref:Importin N-terminal domain-containing protein n=1 Tax=Tritrichomonas foetus TaxID=1144522 RepID=A0A1J4JNK9_9EUKA|nr:hypothetical protein TRFO_07950 [Tritrichomonas foetus]|eukprot:OHT00298.1 hypothetical protein TRFO_07950 [Tritrichomonas foetus]